MGRLTFTALSAIHAGCMDCDKTWETRNALGVAAKHHDATGHTTWCDQIIITRYGETKANHIDKYGARPAV